MRSGRRTGASSSVRGRYDEYFKVYANGWPLCFLFCYQLIRVRVGDGHVHR
jgi:hypothetical protein